MMTRISTTPKRRSPAQRRERHKKPRLPEETPDTPWRLFIAVPVSRDVREQVKAILEDVAPLDLPVRWVDPDNGHLTLHFLGEIEPEMAELLRMTLGVAIAPHEAFDLRTADPGAFPAMKRPRVLWLGLWGPAHRLESLYNDIGDFLDDFGLDIEEDEFHPHITLGRVRTTEGVRIGDLPAAIRKLFDHLTETGLAGANNPRPLPVNEVQLVRSRLSKDGAQYEVLASYPLQTPGE